MTSLKLLTSRDDSLSLGGKDCNIGRGGGGGVRGGQWPWCLHCLETELQPVFFFFAFTLSSGTESSLITAHKERGRGKFLGGYKCVFRLDI